MQEEQCVKYVTADSDNVNVKLNMLTMQEKNPSVIQLQNAFWMNVCMYISILVCASLL